MDIYYHSNEKQFGPIDQIEFKNLIKNGVISKETFIWHKELTDWIKAGDDKELKSSFSYLPPPFLKNKNQKASLNNVQSNKINSSFEFAIKPIFSYADNFSRGLAIIYSKNGNYEYINLKGESVFEFSNNKKLELRCFNFKESFSFSMQEEENIFGKRSTVINFIDFDFNTISKFKYDSPLHLSSLRETKLEYLDDFKVISSGCLLVYDWKKENHKNLFFIDVFGKKVYNDYQPYSRFSENYALVIIFGLFKNKLGFISGVTGKLCEELNDSYFTGFNYQRKFSEGIIPLYNKTTQLFDFCNKSIEVKFSKKYFEVGKFKNGFCSFQKVKDGLIGFINVNGKEVISPKYNEVGFFSEGLCPVKIDKNGKWAYIDKDNNIIIDFIFDSANSFSNNLGCVKYGELFGYIKNPLSNNQQLFIPDYILSLIKEGSTLHAVMEYKKFANIYLSEAQDIIDTLYHNQ